jgi:2-polyprenyl-3-methyl-5-hydroxy-6-metoxy-1,4-benzoquinol methylase
MISKRTNCVVCDGGISHLTTFEDFPVYMGVDNRDDETPKADMSWGCCDNCGCVQLINLIDLGTLYARHHNPAIGSSWTRHHNELSNTIINNLKGLNILEIGGANLKLANAVCRKRPDISYTVVDYSCGKYDTTPVSDKIAQIKSSLTDCDFAQKFDLITHSHTLEHLYQPIEFLRSLRGLLTDDGLMIMSVPNIKEQLKASHLNALNFEHTYYIDDEYLYMMLAKSSFELKRIHQYSNYNNFYICTPLAETELCSIAHTNPEEAEKVFTHFVESIRGDVKSLNKRLLGQPYYSFGAHIFSQYMLSSGLNKKNLIAILDNDPAKIGKKLAGTDIPVISPSELRTISSPKVILRASQYNSEIRKQLQNINHTVELF